MKQDVQNQQTKRGNPYVGFLWVILIVLLLNGLIFPKLSKQKIISTDYGSFIEKVDSGRVKDVMIKSSQIFFTAVDKNGETNTFQTGETNDPQLVERLLDADSPNENGKIAFNQIVPEENSPILNFLLILKSATKLFSVLLASKRPLITELADKLRLKYPLLPTISPCPTMRLEAIRSIIPISCRRYPKSV